MKEIKEDIHKILGYQIDHTERLTRVESDLRYHIRRTDTLQEMVNPVHKMWVIGKGIIAIVTCLLTIGVAWYGIKSAKADDSAPRLKSAFSRIQKKAGCKLKITSGKRSKAHNARIGGAKNSYHVKGMAYDIKPVKRSCISLKKLQHIACKYVSTILYSNHIHIDIRKKPVHLKGWYKWERKKHGIKPGIYHSHHCHITRSK